MQARVAIEQKCTLRLQALPTQCSSYRIPQSQSFGSRRGRSSPRFKCSEDSKLITSQHKDAR
jgi:hypothetical protein